MKDNHLVEKALALAARWQERANEMLTSEERGIQEQMLRLLTHPLDKIILTKLIDQSFRSEDTRRVADQISSLLHEFGVPDFFSSVDKLLVQMFLGVGRYIPSIAVPKVIGKMRHDSSRAIIPGERAILHGFLKRRNKQGVRVNINHLGEAVLGEGEAAVRLNAYLRDLQDSEIEYISVKISTIYSQIQALAFSRSVAVLKDRLARLYREAASNFFSGKKGGARPKFVNLDMEEYRDLAITCEAFQQTLSQEEFKNHFAGIALQSYLPDSFSMQQELSVWARRRAAEGGSPIKIRLVKGANMEMEMVESAIRGWPLATYHRKLHVDANYKRMVDFGMQPENIRAAHLGIASHNLFELAYAYERAKKNDVLDCFSIEMLEGMADHVRRAIAETVEDVVLYAPVATKEEFISAIAYLIRRLDENTADENFLRYAPDLRTDGRTWEYLKEQFVASNAYKAVVTAAPNRIQNRMTEEIPAEQGTFHLGEFRNEPDTDWSLAGNREWAEKIRERWRKTPESAPVEIPIVVGGKEYFGDREIHEALDPSQQPRRVCVARCAMARVEDAAEAVRIARDDPDKWRGTGQRERHRILSRVAAALRKARGDLIGAMASSTGKVFTEADPEVSEAIDFTEYYPHSLKQFAGLEGIHCRGKGVGVVISPWNFPVAIPCGGIIAALSAGNTVIFKPASDATLPAWEICRCFWESGVSKSVLQFLPCRGGGAASRLVGDPRVDFVILTGGTETGLAILKNRPKIFLTAETGGKNATIVTAMSDRDQAIKNIIYSAFGNSGQKCSATSLLILEREVYENAGFKRQLADAVSSLQVGSAWEFHNLVGPLIRPPAGDLKRALTRLEPGESWLVKPENVDGNPYLWAPGVKWDVGPGSYTHKTEFFGPLLGVMCVENLEQAIDMVNATGYGLTSGLESLDEREHKIWKAGVEAGNLYINRGTTGAIVLRQPFGGMKKSALGAGIKAGGPNYAFQYMDAKEVGYPDAGAIAWPNPLLAAAQEWRLALAGGKFPEIQGELYRTIRAIESYLYWMEQEFSREKDRFHIRGQENVLRYRPVGSVMVRVHPDDSLFEILARAAAVRISGCRLEISAPESKADKRLDFLFGYEGRKFVGKTRLLVQSEEEVADDLSHVDRVRFAAPERVPDVVRRKAAESGFYIAAAPVRMQGRIELMHYFREQSICYNYHRYGNLGEKGLGLKTEGNDT